MIVVIDPPVDFDPTLAATDELTTPKVLACLLDEISSDFAVVYAGIVKNAGLNEELLDVILSVRDVLVDCLCEGESSGDAMVCFWSVDGTVLSVCAMKAVSDGALDAILLVELTMPSLAMLAVLAALSDNSLDCDLLAEAPLEKTVLVAIDDGLADSTGVSLGSDLLVERGLRTVVFPVDSGDSVMR